MSDAATDKLLVFSEEYVKVTKGMYAVWMNHAWGASRRWQVDVLLNREHWAFDEANKAFDTNTRVAVLRMPFRMPSTLLGRGFVAGHHPWLLRGGRIVLGQALDLVFLPAVMLYLCLWLRKIRPRAVFSHAGGWPAAPLCRWIIYAAALARVPKRILIIHNYPMKKTGLAWKVLAWPLRLTRTWLISKCATSIVTVSDSVKASLESEVFKRTVLRIHNGIQLSPPIPQSLDGRSRPDWQPSGLVVGFVGALYPLKGPHVLLDAFRFVKAPCELALLGPADQAYLLSLQRRAALCPNKVTFLGFCDDVDWFLERIDILVVPSIAFESFGMVILEAMRHKKAVICTDFGGMKEVVENGVTGLVVPAGDAQALAGAITKLLAETAVRRQMGEAGYRRFLERFTAERMVDQYDGLILGRSQ